MWALFTCFLLVLGFFSHLGGRQLLSADGGGVLLTFLTLTSLAATSLINGLAAAL